MKLKHKIKNLIKLWLKKSKVLNQLRKSGMGWEKLMKRKLNWKRHKLIEPDESDSPLIRARYEHAKFCDIPVDPYGLAHACACNPILDTRISFVLRPLSVTLRVPPPGF